MTKCLYFEIGILCILILVVLIRNVKKRYTLMFEDRLFLSILWIAIGLFLTDCAWILIDGVRFTGARTINNLLNLIYFILTGVIGLLWVIYTDYKIYESEERLKQRFKWYAIPFAILFIMTFLSPWTGWIFVLCENNLYHRGRYHAIQMLVAYGYLLWGAIQSLVACKRTEKRYLKGEYRTLASFIIFPVIGGIVQSFYEGFPLIWAGIAISILNVFVYTQNQQITKDGLTGINNRRYLNCYLDTKLNNKRRKKKLFFVLLDIDSFKQINDTYGHVEGDAAIIRVTEILKEVCSRGNDFLARYGGDEFAIICEREDIQEVENMVIEIDELVSFSNHAGDMKYEVWLSIGYAELGECDKKEQDQLIALADERLYRVKELRKKHKKI